MTALIERIRLAREQGDPAAIVGAVPYAKFLGIEMEAAPGGDVRGRFSAAERLIGNASLGHLHGGATAALLESTAIFELLWRAETAAVPKTINITLQYLRSGKARDTFARADITRLGRRVANVYATAWQEDETRPIAAAVAHFLLSPPESP